MTPGRSGKQCVNRCNWPAHPLGRCDEFSPNPTGFKINRKNALRIIAFQGLQPSLKRTLLQALGE